MPPVSKTLRVGVRGGEFIPATKRGCRANPINEVYIPIYKKIGIGKKSQWVLSWRPAVAKDLRGIWDGTMKLDNATTRESVTVSTHYRITDK